MKNTQYNDPNLFAMSNELRANKNVKRPSGFKYSVHDDWDYLGPYGRSPIEEWAFDGATFLCRLGEENPSSQIKVVVRSREGEPTKEHFLNPSDLFGTQGWLYDLWPEFENVLFDPVLYENGVRKDQTRFGWVTLTGVHPLSLFPEPVIYWAIGPDAYQALLPWHMPLSVKHSCELAHCAAPYSNSSWSDSNEDDLLVMPGSIVHAGHLPPFTALVKYDMFSVSEIEDAADYLHRY